MINAIGDKETLLTVEEKLGEVRVAISSTIFRIDATLLSETVQDEAVQKEIVKARIKSLRSDVGKILSLLNTI